MQLWQAAARPQDLKRKYGAQWALVTGGSSGIGKALAERLASQGLSVVLVALDDDVLDRTHNELAARFPSISFRKVGVNLGRADGYMPQIEAATGDITVQLVFNNAGFILPGFFAETGMEKLEANYECNATAAMRITHHFLRRLQEAKLRGTIGFTSSAGAYFPGPTAAMYSSTKAFMTSFATSIAAEVRDVGIDVVVVHPSPIQSNFYTKTAGALSSLAAAQKAAASPFVIADALLSAPGRVVVWDQGSTTVAFRLILKVVDFAFFIEVASRLAARFNPDHAALAAKSALRRK